MRPITFKIILFGGALLVPLAGFVLAQQKDSDRPSPGPEREPDRWEMAMRDQMYHAIETGNYNVAAETAREYLLSSRMHFYQEARRVYREYMDYIPLDVRLDRLSVPSNYLEREAPQEANLAIYTAEGLPVLQGLVQASAPRTPPGSQISRIRYWAKNEDIRGRVPINTARGPFRVEMSSNGQIIWQWDIVPRSSEAFNPALSHRGSTLAHTLPQLRLEVVPPIDFPYE